LEDSKDVPLSLLPETNKFGELGIDLVEGLSPYFEQKEKTR
jgi:hypothetical protein